MKKCRYLLPAILLSLVTFAACWFSDQRYDCFWIYMVPIDLILLACFIVLLVLCIRRIAKDKAYVEFVSAAVLVLLMVLVVFFPFRDVKVKLELRLYDTPRQEIVEMIRSRELQPEDGRIIIQLPAGYRRISTSGTVVQHKNDAGGQVIGFWVFRGVPDGAIEVIYSSGGEELIRANVYGIERIEKLKDDWYYVITD